MSTPLPLPNRRVVFTGSPAQLRAWLPTQQAPQPLIRQALVASTHRRGETLALLGAIGLLLLAGLAGCATRPAPRYTRHPHSYPIDARVRRAEPGPSRVR